MRISGTPLRGGGIKTIVVGEWCVSPGCRRTSAPAVLFCALTSENRVLERFLTWCRTQAETTFRELLRPDCLDYARDRNVCRPGLGGTSGSIQVFRNISVWRFPTGLWHKPSPARDGLDPRAMDMILAPAGSVKRRGAIENSDLIGCQSAIGSRFSPRDATGRRERRLEDKG
jgi:hypothetical protein